ncbi:MAG: cytochrome P450 [Gammaproteobacteria bacterium]|nr:cytochrome P450 [Gammaproteobacteria bacterium]MBT5152902.1 cytochrome P450 [Gammaproteobacteria bacterium]MBT5684718.1 cytochrome P450 [Gammaproteobacteria bacterium]MBT5723746.1 cytochrome P450 [Gammaproteobacteria bacterium]MBT6586547.1 cytochrome P450 [Gammaproteobacteria bacterium]
MKCPMSLEDVDLFAPGAQEHWYDAYPILHGESPVHKLAGEGLTPDTDAFILTKHEDINTVVRDADRFPPLMSGPIREMAESGVDVENVPNLNAMQASMVTLRPNMDLWRAHRQELTDPWVGPGASRHEAMITKHVDDLIDSWIDKEEIDFIKEFARPLPQRVMASVLGFPLEDIPQLGLWGEAQVKAFVYGRGHQNKLDDEEIREQFVLLDGFKEYVQEKVKEKRENPQQDMISFLTEVTYSPLGRKLTDLEVNGIVYAMIIGGLETTQYAIEEQAQLICEHEGLFDRLKNNRDLVRQFTEEGMRMRSPTQGLSTRQTSQDEVFQGVTVPKGSVLHLRWAAANVDPDEFECPFELRLDRKAVTRHLTFSAGPRVCPGAGISRIEQQLAWSRLLDRLDDIQYGSDNKLLHQPGIMLGTLELNLKIRKAS